MPQKRRKVLLIGLDGGRGDLVFQHSELFRTQFYNYSDPYTRCSRTHSGPATLPDMQWKTSPGWSSVLSGMNNHKHQVYDNSVPSIWQAWLSGYRYGNLFHWLQQQDIATVAAGRPSVLRAQADIGILDMSPISSRQGLPVGDTEGDHKNIRFIQEQIRIQSHAQFFFLHLDGLDQAGHRHGWNSRAYVRAVQKLDTQILPLLYQITQRPSTETWLVLATADHGGHGKNHGLQPGTDNCIPIFSSRLLTGKPVMTQLDVAPTILRYLRVSIPVCVDGQALYVNT